MAECAAWSAHTYPTINVAPTRGGVDAAGAVPERRVSLRRQVRRRERKSQVPLEGDEALERHGHTSQSQSTG
jgi:hypothetical protein